MKNKKIILISISFLLLSFSVKPVAAVDRYCGTVCNCTMSGGSCLERCTARWRTCDNNGENCGSCWNEGYYLSGLPCAPGGCGEPVNCNCNNISCSVSCPSGTSTTNTGPLCRTTVSNSCANSCGQSGQCSSSRTCYYPETNLTSPNQPTSISVQKYGEFIQTSSDTNNATPVTANNLTLSLPQIDTPTSTRGVGYYFKIFDSNGTEVYTSPSPTGQTNNRRNETPEQNIPSNIFTPGETYKVSGMYYYLDRCDESVDNGDYSTPVEGYIYINREPQPVCTGPCDQDDIFTNLGANSTYGCSNSSYIGQELNNPVEVSVSLTDADGNSEIEGVMLWLRKISGAGVDNTGVLILKNSEWNNLSVYKPQNNSWVLANDNYIQNTNGENISSILNLTASENSTVSIQFNLAMLEANTPIEGEYEIFLQGVDMHMIPQPTTDPTYMDKLFNFDIDLTTPTLEEEIVIDYTDIENITFSWNSSDGESGLQQHIINGYVDIDDPNLLSYPIFINGQEISNVTPPLGQNPEEIGHMDDPNALQLPSTDQNISLNIGENEFGDVSVYIRAFDNACNSELRSNFVTLSPWSATKGGYFYSQEGSRTEAKDISSLTELNDQLTKLTVDEVSQGSEVLSTRSNNIYQIIHPELNAVSAIEVSDVNNQRNFWFKKIIEIANIENNLSSPTEECAEEYCFYHSTNSETDITFPTDFKCTGKTVFVSERNITISPHQTDIATDGCIYIARNNIIIRNQGHEPTAETIAYDYLEGAFIAENEIIISNGTTVEDKKYGLEVDGQLIAFGSNSTRGIRNNRSLKALNLISPSLLVNYNPKYSKYSEELIGKISTAYIEEIGLSSN